MFRRVISATERTNVSAELSALNMASENARLSPESREMMIASVREVLLQLIDRGNQLAAMGSQMSVTRDIAGTGYSIKLKFSANNKPSFLQRLLNSFRGS